MALRQATRLHKPRRAAGKIYDLAHQIRIDLRRELIWTQVNIFNSWSKLAGVKVAQILRIKMLQVSCSADGDALTLGHLLAADIEKTMDVNLRRQFETGCLQHAGPKKRMEISNVLADEMMNFSRLAFRSRPARPPIVK